MRTSYDVIKSLIRTEKSTSQEKQRQYSFRVAPVATKIDIKRAIEDIYKVKVQDVNTIHVLGKLKRVRFKAGYSSSWKKAVVSLQEGQKIEVA